MECDGFETTYYAETIVHILDICYFQSLKLSVVNVSISRTHFFLHAQHQSRRNGPLPKS